MYYTIWALHFRYLIYSARFQTPERQRVPRSTNSKHHITTFGKITLRGLHPPNYSRYNGCQRKSRCTDTMLCPTTSAWKPAEFLTMDYLLKQNTARKIFPFDESTGKGFYQKWERICSIEKEGKNQSIIALDCCPRKFWLIQSKEKLTYPIGSAYLNISVGDFYIASRRQI